MDIVRDTHFDFMKYRTFWIVVSVALLVVGVFSIFVHGALNIGLDFAGGTQVTLKFAESPRLDELREFLAKAGVEEAVIQRFDEEEKNQVIVKTATVAGTEEGSRDPIVDVLTEHYNAGRTGLDLNDVGAATLAAELRRLDPDGVGGDPAHYDAVAASILGQRRNLGLFASWEDIGRTPGVSPAVVDALRAGGFLGSFAVLGVENVGPQIGEELRTKGLLAVVLSIVGMLIYIWIRFELEYGVGAIMATMHDVLVALGLFALLGFEFNLTTIAAFLTLVGYSVNDKIVIFDRVRENRAKSKAKPLIDVMNDSLNQTLSRTILTGGALLLAVTSLFVLGGEVLRGFAFVQGVGVVVGTYSSVYIACPFALLWEQLLGHRRRATRKPGEAAAPGKAPARGGKPAAGGRSGRPKSAA
jgi:preprotein translocase subunit SecF